MADVIQIPMTLDQYLIARQALASSPVVISNAPTSMTTGNVRSQQLDFSYTYDGGSMLTMTITAKHGFEAKLASDDQIKTHIMKLLA